eukprot:gene8017-8843_t
MEDPLLDYQEKLSVKYHRSGNGEEVVKVFQVSPREKPRWECCVRVAFQISSEDEVFLVINEDLICYPLRNVDLTEASKARSLEVKTFPKSAAAQQALEASALLVLPPPALTPPLPPVSAMNTATQDGHASFPAESDPSLKSNNSNPSNNVTSKEDKRKFNRGLDVRRSYLKEEKMLVMYLKDCGRSAEDIAQLTSVSKSNVEKWCSDKTREAILAKYRAQCQDSVFLAAFSSLSSPSSLHFNVSAAPQQSLLAAQYLLEKLRIYSTTSPLLILGSLLLGPTSSSAAGGGGGGGAEGQPPAKRSKTTPSSSSSLGDDVNSLNGTGQHLTQVAGESGRSHNDYEVAGLLHSLQGRSTSKRQSQQSRSSLGSADSDDDSDEEDGREMNGMQLAMDQFNSVKAFMPQLSDMNEDITMQYNVPLNFDDLTGLSTSAQLQATRPLLKNTRFLTQMRDRMRQSQTPRTRTSGTDSDDEDEEEDRAVLSMLGE